jgi:hypothetical protein
MTRAAFGVDYEADLISIREKYVCATPRQRLSVIRQRLEDHHFGPNRLITVMSAVEALARALAMNHICKSKAELNKLYPKYRNRAPKSLVKEYLLSKGITDPDTYFGEDTWRLFSYAIEYRNLLAHECTYLGLDKFPSLIDACNEILNSLAKLGRVREKQT